MSDILTIALVSLHQDMGKIDRIAQNLANTGTPGYKREVAAARPFAQTVEELSAAPAPTGAADAGTGTVQVRVDPAPGTLRVTGQPLDLALEGEGYFEVATAEGPAYTRQGDFQVDATGRLVTADGHAVMGTSGEITLRTRAPVIDVTGRITEPESVVGATALPPGTPAAQLKIIRFEKGTALRHLGNGLLALAGAPQPAGAGEVSIRQGALENSNVKSMQEMVQLMQTVRHFESVHRIVQGYDEILTTSIRKLGELS